MVARGRLGADHRRHQREVVVLHQDDRILVARLGDHGIGEALVDGPVVLPVRLPEHRAHMGDVTQRPHAFVGEAVVVALLLLGAEPDAPQDVLLVPGRHADPVMPVDDLAVGAAAAVRDPDARAGAHHRLDRRHQSAGGSPDDDAVRAVLVDVGLPVRDDDDLVALQLRAQQRAQPLRIPVPACGPWARRYSSSRSRMRKRISAARGAISGVAIIGRTRPSPRSRPRAPDIQPRQLSCATTTVISAIVRPSAAMKSEEIAPRVLAAPIDEAQVVQEHQLGDGAGLALDRVHADVDRTARQAKARLGQVGGDLRLLAVQRARKAGAAPQHRSIERTQADGEQALVLHRAIEEGLQAGALGVADRVADRVGQRVGHQGAAHVQVAGEPAQREAIHQRQREIRGRDQRHEQRRKETELEVERLHRITPAAPPRLESQATRRCR